MLGRPALESVSEVVTWSFQDIHNILLRFLRWKTFRRFSCLSYVVQVSLLEINMLRPYAYINLHVVIIPGGCGSARG